MRLLGVLVVTIVGMSLRVSEELDETDDCLLRLPVEGAKDSMGTPSTLS